MNRMLQELRGYDLIVLRGGTLTINDHQALRNTALFSANTCIVIAPQPAGGCKVEAAG
ncbi:MAG: hypothetical protein KGK16_17280 [Bradyrhizobium sp.]|nr:hypothetical protein [Bradyrhizobium sp.]